MFTDRILKFYLFVHVTILLSYINYVFASPCIRIPQGTGAGKSFPTGNFRVRVTDDAKLYIPGRQYTIFIDRRATYSRISAKPKFTGFFLAVEQKSSPPSDVAEEFSEAKHGKLTVDESFETTVKLACGNVATHSSDTPKSEVQVIWTAPETGSGCITIRATIIENRDSWYMDEGVLTQELCEDEDAQKDFISNVLEQCCACNEAKYELSFEGLWSKHTHPKHFPRNVYTTKFGDIIGATHKIGNGFWANGQTASDGLKEVAETGSTRSLEAELKSKSDSIRTIIKARGLAHPNITGKTFAVFRVDSENHLVSFVSTIMPSPDWFVGVSAMELCQPDCTWLESKVVDLYPWDAGTDGGLTYVANNDELSNRENIRRITSEYPGSQASPFYDENGSKMKPLARLTLSRQRLYEKNCTAEQSASDDCQVGEYGAWGECTGGVCGGNGKQYRQRYYKNPDKATKCHRKLFETKTCTMPRCTHENEESLFNDPDCDAAVSYSSWGPCLPKCKNSDNEMGIRKRKLKYNSRKSFKECGLRMNRQNEQEEPCEIKNWCVGQNQDEQTDEPQLTYDTPEQTTQINCEGTYRKAVDGECIGICGIGERNRTRISKYPDQCEPLIETNPCNLKPCKNEDFCLEVLDSEQCPRNENPTNFIYYDATTCTCMVFTTYCVKEDNKNIFETFDDCKEACPIDADNCFTRLTTTNRKRPRREP